jgi:hypothetical protein
LTGSSALPTTHSAALTAAASMPPRTTPSRCRMLHARKTKAKINAQIDVAGNRNETY